MRLARLTEAHDHDRLLLANGPSAERARDTAIIRR